MKKILALASTVLFTASLSFAQATGGSTDANAAGKKQAGSKHKATPADKVALNPQPLPPGAKSGGSTPASKVELNPQPLPPRQNPETGNSAASKVELNPQPLPPRQNPGTGNSAASKVELNPQPLPPGAQASGKKGSTARSKKGSAGGTTSTTPK